ncbi:MAG: FAD-dependent monooxygenase [Stappiaceae bacterium]
MTDPLSPSSEENQPSNINSKGHSEHKIIIAGGGIGGLSAALALSQRGINVALIEREDGFREVGAGIQLSPNANHVLRELGVLPELETHIGVVDSVRIYSARTGAIISTIPLGQTIAERHGAPYHVAHRADLHSVLLQACLSDPNIQIRLGSTIADAVADEDGITVEFNTADGLASQRGSALIGADGVRSVVRRRILRLPAAAFSGKVAYRTTIATDQVPNEIRSSTGLWLGSNAHVVHYPIRQGRELNIVAIVDEDWEEDGWSSPGNRQAVLDRFADWPENIQDLLGKPRRWLKWALFGMDAGGIWSEGRISVLGDAAHAMLPFVAQGGAMAIEDGWVLAKHVSEISDIPSALRAYEEERRARVDKVAATAFENGRIYHLSGLTARARDMTMRMMSAERLLGRYDWLYGWKP